MGPQDIHSVQSTAMHPDTREVAAHMQDFALTVLGRAAYQCTFSDMGAPYGHAMAVLHAAHGAELAIKARIADEHPLLIFNSLPKSGTTTEQLSIKELFEQGRTIQFNELPEALWAATGIRMNRVEQYQKFGKYRNIIMHFAAPAEDWSTLTMEFLFQVVEPMVHEFWGESIIAYAPLWDEVTVAEGYLEKRLKRSGIEITQSMREAITLAGGTEVDADSE